MSMLDLGAVLAAEQPRDIETITGEILELKQTAGNAILGIGQRLNEAKAVLNHGEWLPWLTERVEFSERSAQTFMKLAREWSNPQALADLGSVKALTLLALPPEEREQFMAETHEVDGQEKTVVDMTSRELEKAIRERKEALAAAEAAKADAKHAEESRAKMAEDMELAQNLLDAANAEKEAAQATVAELEAKLKALNEAPVEVAVEVDQAAVDKARAEAIAEMQAKLDKANSARAKVQDKLKAAEEALAQVNAKLEQAQSEGRQAVISGDKDLATFELLFSQSQEQINKLHGLLLKVRSRGDAELAGKLQNALVALSEMTRGCAQ